MGKLKSINGFDFNIKTSLLFSRLQTALLDKNKDVFCLQGGTSSTKTFSTLQMIIILACCQSKTHISVCSQNLPHLKRGAIKDFYTITGTNKFHYRWNNEDKCFLFPNNSKIEFISVDNMGKALGGRRDILFLNEVDEIEKEISDQLMIRTNKLIFLDWNPKSTFWAHEGFIDKSNVWFDISTHWDNPFLPEKIRRDIEEKKLSDPTWYRVYGQGLIGQYEGLVFDKLEYQDLNENDFKQFYYGLDFCFYPDPNVLIKVAFVKDVVYIIRELVVDKIDNIDIGELIKPIVKDEPVFCDSAEPKSVYSLRTRYNINSYKTPKPPDSRRFGISWLRNKRVVINSTCQYAKKEFSRFSRIKDKNGNILPIYQDGEDHTIDAVRYALSPFILQKTDIKMERLLI